MHVTKNADTAAILISVHQILLDIDVLLMILYCLYSEVLGHLLEKSIFLKGVWTSEVLGWDMSMRGRTGEVGRGRWDGEMGWIWRRWDGIGGMGEVGQRKWDGKDGMVEMWDRRGEQWRWDGRRSRKGGGRWV